jgi:hypothetical protein
VNASSTQTLTNKTLTAAGGNTVEATSGPTSTQLAGMRNKIINGAMMIDQRNAGASVTPGNAQYLLDRWQSQTSQSSKYSVQQSSTVPAGFTNSLKVTSLSAYTVGSSDFFAILQAIEGYNAADLAWGSASAKAVTLSFNVYSSLTGTFGGSIISGSGSYPFTYSIASANTWTSINVVVPANTSYAPTSTTNGVGIYVSFGLGVGSTYAGTSGSWQSGFFESATGATSVVGTNGATFYITGVQLEKGATATPFENRLYGTELALCQRYYRQTGISGSNTEGSIYGYGVATTGFIGQSIPHPVPMRAAPTAAYAGTWVRVNATGGLQAFSESYLPFLTPTTTGTSQQYSNNSGYITFSAEL